jgi:hypothetical protein
VAARSRWSPGRSSNRARSHSPCGSGLFEVPASKQGISAAELHRKLGVGRYQTAWSWLQKIRAAMVRPNRQPLSGEAEIDESYVGGPEAGKRLMEACNLTSERKTRTGQAPLRI